MKKLASVGVFVGGFAAAYAVIGGLLPTGGKVILFGAPSGPSVDVETIRTIIAAVIGWAVQWAGKNYPDWLKWLREQMGVPGSELGTKVDAIAADVKAIKDKVGA